MARAISKIDVFDLQADEPTVILGRLDPGPRLK
jgi:hypothetical protein